MPPDIQWLKRIGLITYNLTEKECEIVSLNSFQENSGIGSLLIEEVRKAADKRNCSRIWLITTNDNTKALRYYQKRGFHLVNLYPDSIKLSRKLKPGIPLNGIDNIPIRDEIEMEILLSEDE